MERKRFYRVAFLMNGVPKGSMLIAERSVEMAISRCAQSVGKGFEVHSVNPLFFSDEEEHDFVYFVISGNPALEGDVVNLRKRMAGEL